MSTNGKQPTSQREYARAFILANSYDVKRTLLSGETSADKWARKAKINGATFNQVLREFGFQYTDSGWFHREREPDTTVEVSFTHKDILDVMEDQLAFIEHLEENLAIMRAQDQMKTERIAELERQVAEAIQFRMIGPIAVRTKEVLDRVRMFNGE